MYASCLFYRIEGWDVTSEDRIDIAKQERIASMFHLRDNLQRICKKGLEFVKLNLSEEVGLCPGTSS